MKNIFVSSIEKYSGKSAVITALGQILHEKGLKVGYFKPFGVNTIRIGDQLVDEDAYNIANVLNTGDDMEDVCQVKLDRPYADFVRAAPDAEELKRRVTDAYKRISEGKDVVLVEGAVDYKTGKGLGISDLDVSRALGLNVLMVVKYTNDFVLDEILAAKELFGERLEFVLFNQLIGYKKVHVKDIAERLLKREGIGMIGTMPYDPLLAGLFVTELGDTLKGKWLVKLSEDVIIEDFLIGAMSPQAALKYLRRVRKAVLITGGDRADLQNLALEIGNINCLLLTGNLEPPRTMLGKAEEKGVPVIVVADDTLTTMQKVEEVFGKAGIKGDVKLKRIKELVEQFVDLERLEVEKF